MRRLCHIVGCLMLAILGPIFGQGITLAGAGYAGIPNIRVAPGQIATFFATGLNPMQGPLVKATSLPLPNSLGGISVTINQSVASVKHSYAAPLLAVQQLNACSDIIASPPPPSGSSPDCLLTAVTAQIPNELPALPIGAESFAAVITDVVITQNGTASKAFLISVQPDNLHVLNTCDSFPSAGLAANSCGPVVAHADGSLVSGAKPARAGEEVVIYAFGLGQTSPAVRTGTATPSPAPVLSGTVFVQFDLRPNAAPSPPYFNPLIMAPVIPGAAFVGLTPGQVGLYQINVRIPNPLPAVGSCNASAQRGVSYSTVDSNLTIDIGAANSFDGAPICVAPQ